MKLNTSIAPRRDGKLPKVVMPDGGTYTADESGVYDVPESIGNDLIATGNFSNAEDTNADKVDANVIVSEDGTEIDLDEMTRAELVEFAKDNFSLEFKQADNKSAIVAAIMAAAKPDKAE